MLQQTILDPSPAARPTWDQVVAAHSARVHRHAMRLTGNRADADDLTQEVFVRVFRSFDSFEDQGSGSFEGWLHRITTNLFLDQVRRRARQRTAPLTEAAEELGSAPGASDAAMAAAFEADVEVALAELAPEFRAPVLLADVDGLSYEEVAEVLGLKLGTVRSRIHRGRARLRRALAHRAPSGGRRRYAGPADPALLPLGG